MEAFLVVVMALAVLAVGVLPVLGAAYLVRLTATPAGGAR